MPRIYPILMGHWQCIIFNVLLIQITTKLNRNYCFVILDNFKEVNERKRIPHRVLCHNSISGVALPNARLAGHRGPRGIRGPRANFMGFEADFYVVVRL